MAKHDNLDIGDGSFTYRHNQTAIDTDITIDKLAEPTELQRRAFDLINTTIPQICRGQKQQTHNQRNPYTTTVSPTPNHVTSD